MNLNPERIKLRLLLGLHIKGKGYESHEDALYDIIKYMDEKGSSSINFSSLHYALNFKVSNEYLEEVMAWACSSLFFEEKISGTKKTYRIIKSPFT